LLGNYFPILDHNKLYYIKQTRLCEERRRVARRNDLNKNKNTFGIKEFLLCAFSNSSSTANKDTDIDTMRISTGVLFKLFQSPSESN